MSKVSIHVPSENHSGTFPVDPSFLKGKRNPTQSEISILQHNDNRCSDPQWRTLFVSEAFDPTLIHDTEFYGTVVIGELRKATLKFHDLELETGIVNSYIDSCVFGDDVCIRNVSYLQNYSIGSRVMIFNVQEMSCTVHSKFGNGILKEGEPEENRIWIGVGNENGGRDILPFESMIPADAYIWSRYREDKELMKKFIDLTEEGHSRQNNTCGIVGDDVVIKNTSLIKDVKIGPCAYIKGAFKLKNITICSSEEESSQIGEGVEMVNGIMGYGSKAFYQSVAVRFVLGRNCQLKYGARLLNSVLGDNSTVSCCELLNNLIFPFHEQHHNTSFLIASTVKGQSNIAAGATIGSNHNSRSPDGEIYAGRGFWPGLCSDFKHNSKFASFTLISKGSYQYELNITYPFSLVSRSSEEEGISIMPAYWFMYNMFAMARNNSKFKNRDVRAVKVQNIETDPLAPDTMQEVLSALDRIIHLTENWLMSNDLNYTQATGNMYQKAKDFLHQNPDADLTFVDPLCMKKFGAKIVKPVQGYKEYRKITKYFAVKTLSEYCKQKNIASFSTALFSEILSLELYTEWVNIGGQIIPVKKLEHLFALIKKGSIKNWDEVHAFYNDCDKEYLTYKVRYALYLLETLYSRPVKDFTKEIYADILKDVTVVSDYMYTSSISSRQKDYTDFFRSTTYRNMEEMTAVVGRIEDNSFLKKLKVDTESFNTGLTVLFKELVD